MSRSPSRTSARVRKAARDHQNQHGTSYREALTAVKDTAQSRRVLHVIGTDVHGNPYMGPASKFPYASTIPFATWYEREEFSGTPEEQVSVAGRRNELEPALASYGVGALRVAVTGGLASGKTEFAKRAASGLLGMGSRDVKVVVAEDDLLLKYSAYKELAAHTPAKELQEMVLNMFHARVNALKEGGSFRSWADYREAGNRELPFILFILDHMDYSPPILEAANLIGVKGRELGVGLMAVKLDVSDMGLVKNNAITLNARRVNTHRWEMTDMSSTSFDVTFTQSQS